MFINLISFDCETSFMLRLLRHTIIALRSGMFREVKTGRRKLSGDDISGSSEIWSEKLCIKRRKPLNI